MPALSPFTLPIALTRTGTAVAVSEDESGAYDVALAGRPYMVDWRARSYTNYSAPLLRAQADQSQQPGAQSVNPEGLWRKYAETWRVGAGQAEFDRDDSEQGRFRTSKGVDPWTPWELSLLPDTVESLDSSNTALYLQPAAGRLYVTDGTALKYSSNPEAASPTWTTVTGTPSAATSICSDGYQVMTAHATSGIYLTDVASGSSASWVTGTVDLVAYVRSRVMAANGADLYNVTTAYSTTGALPAALMTHRNSDWSWVGFAEGDNYIYAAGYSGTQSAIYKIGIKDDATALDAPVVARSLPDGEVITAIYGYQGFILIGTTTGIRFAVPDGNGDLTLGSLIETGDPVRDFEGEGKYVWFTWETFDTTSSGLGRLDLSVLSDPEQLTPAYASDLMVTSQAEVQSVVTFEGQRYFTVKGDGVYTEDDDLVATGYVDSGIVSYQIVEQKTAVDIALTATYNGGSIAAAIDVGAGFQTLDSASSDVTSTISAQEKTGKKMEIRLTLSRSSVDTTAGPVLESWMLRTFPKVPATEYITVPILLHEQVYGNNGAQFAVDVQAERENLKALASTRQLTIFQEGDVAWSVVVEDFNFEAHDPTNDRGAIQGTMTMKMKVV